MACQTAIVGKGNKLELLGHDLMMSAKLVELLQTFRRLGHGPETNTLCHHSYVRHTHIDIVYFFFLSAALRAMKADAVAGPNTMGAVLVIIQFVFMYVCDLILRALSLTIKYYFVSVLLPVLQQTAFLLNGGRDKRKMGKKLNLSHLSEEEVSQIMEVIQKDFQIRREEKRKVTELHDQLVKEQTKIQLLKEKAGFNSTHCVICLESFGLLIRRKRSCYKCGVKVCSKCSLPRPKKAGQFICPVCNKEKKFKILSNQWLYDSQTVSDKHFGSCKVVRYLYKKSPHSASDTEADSGYLASSTNSATASQKHRPRLDQVFDISLQDNTSTSSGRS
ncbi:hypothetical protein Btru_007420 [Bulinus truncatus]|nr:hypothetical protein Btru_007420 [Bulinus truncatus]